MRQLGRILGIGFALVIALLVAGAYWIQDANRLKSELEALIAENSEYTAKINGDIKWALFPPLELKIEDLSLQRPGETINANVELKMDLSAMWEDLDSWQVSELHLVDTVLVQDDATTTINRFQLLDFQINQPAEFLLDASYKASADEPPIAAVLAGTLAYYPETASTPQRITLTDTTVYADMVEGVCNADLSEVQNPPAAPGPASDDDLLPLAVLLSYNVGAECQLSKLTLEEETFHDVTVEITNIDGLLNLLIDVKDFLGGTLLTDIDIDVTQNPAAWTVLPDINNVDSQRLMDWTDQNMQWIAPIAFNSSIKMRGNSPAELINSVQAQSEFDGGQGQINIAKIKRQLMQIAMISGQASEVSQWPDLWDYENFTGLWRIDGAAHFLKFTLDNMSIDAEGTIDYAADTLDMLAQVTVFEAPEASPFSINPLLQGTPIPVRCTGPTADPKCRLEQGAAQNLIARALQRDDESGLRQKLEEKIEEDVPEEYRETARSLLDLLGRALERN